MLWARNGQGNLKGLQGHAAAGRLKRVVLGALLVGMTIVGPLVAYAGVSVIWPSSTYTVNVNQSPPITFVAGADQATAQALGFTGAFGSTNNGASYTLTVSGLSGGRVTIDKLADVDRTSAVASYKMQVATALGSGIIPTILKLRHWTGGTAPTADGDSQVCAVLDLKAAQGTESSGSCSAATVFTQLVYELPSGQTTQSDTVSFRPSSIVFA
jgi:hypothetical protein